MKAQCPGSEPQASGLQQSVSCVSVQPSIPEHPGLLHEDQYVLLGFSLQSLEASGFLLTSGDAFRPSARFCCNDDPLKCSVSDLVPSKRGQRRGGENVATGTKQGIEGVRHVMSWGEQVRQAAWAEVVGAGQIRQGGKAQAEQQALKPRSVPTGRHCASSAGKHRTLVQSHALAAADSMRAAALKTLLQALWVYCAQWLFQLFENSKLRRWDWLCPG